MAIDEQNDIQQDLQEQKVEKICPKRGSFKLEVYDWLQDIPQVRTGRNLVEVRFKSTRKDIYENVNDLPLEYGDIVAVEASPGHDIGVVSLKGELVYQQLKKNKMSIPKEGFKKIYRVARQTDIDKWNEAQALEYPTMIKSRRISKKMKLNMKIGDVEFQGDRTKAIFYYIADERVDFRELIKVLAEEFKIRIEMRQIGARQEAGRIGGIGPCGKALCCSLFISRFVSVSTQAARYQELSLNPQKLAGQCGKLKCCLNYEADSYIDAQKDFPNTSIPLLFGGGLRAFHQKTDVYKRTMWYSFQKDSVNTFVALSVDKVKEIIEMNKQGKELDKLESDQVFEDEDDEPDFENVVGQESLTRFDNKNRRKKKKKPSGSSPSGQPRQDSRPPRPQQAGDATASPADPQAPKPANQPQQNNPNRDRQRDQRRDQKGSQGGQQNPNPNQNRDQNRNQNPNQNRDRQGGQQREPQKDRNQQANPQGDQAQKPNPQGNPNRDRNNDRNRQRNNRDRNRNNNQRGEKGSEGAAPSPNTPAQE